MNKEIFKDSFQEFIYIGHYSRWDDTLNRRENWQESVKRYCDFMKEKYQSFISSKEYNDVYSAILGLEVMPSMRALWSAGKALSVDNIAGYNCSFVAIEKIKDFCDIMYILMNGAGVGFSVEKKYIENLPIIAKEISLSKKEIIIFEDSKIGWAQGFEKVLNCLWAGIAFECDYSLIRAKGERLKTFGGRASGPEPLISLINFITHLVNNNRGTTLQSIDIHDIVCKIAEIVVVGGIRRSACISLSDLSDLQMSSAKSGDFHVKYPHRQFSNNSVAYDRKPDLISFLHEWENLYTSNSGERGFFNRLSSKNKASENSRRLGEDIEGINPCGEILLRNREFCNLSEIVIRPEDTFESLKRKVKIAAIIGTWQAGLTSFKYIDKKWKNNCEEEALLGVSLTGLRDHKILGTTNDTAKKWLADLKHIAIATNKKIAQKIGIKNAAAITCVKPSGTVSLLVNSSAGAHVRNTKTGYYIRRVRISATDPLFRLMRDQKVPFKCEVGQTPDTCNTFVLEFPCKAPKNSTTRKTESITEQLEYWKMLKDFWCEHNPSVTIFIKEDEWLDTAAWVYKNFEELGGLAFMPSDDSIYQLAPYEDITEEQYKALVSVFPTIDYSKLSLYENEDNTSGAKEFACTANGCAIV